MSGSTMVTVGIDIGTTSVKAVAVDDDGRVVARTRIPHRLLSPDEGTFEHEIDVAWNGDVVAALAAVADGLDVAAVNVSAMVPSLGAVDDAGRARSPGLIYGDRRGETDTNVADEAGDAGELLAFLEWLATNAPDAAGYWPAQAVANHALCGVAAIDSATAMTATPLFDMTAWDETIATGAGTTTATLPVVVPGTDPAGTVRDQLPAGGALVGGGTIDALAEQIVAGADEVGDVLVICGATLIVWGVIDRWETVPGLWTVPHTAPGTVLIGGPSNAGGMFVDRVHHWLDLAPSAPFDPPAPDDCPLWLPYVRGERVPLHRRDLRASLHDAGLHHGPEHLRRAAYEATGFVVRHQIDLAASAGLRPRRVVAVGGGSQSPGWMQALADVTGLPVDVGDVAEGAALGAAFMARCTAGLDASMTDARRWARPSHRVMPDPAWRAPCEDRYRRFRERTRDACATPPDRPPG